MIKSPYSAVSVLTLSASLLFATTAMADEEYDVKAYGPKSPIVWNTPIKATFEHAVHTRDAGLECSSCHDDTFSMQRGTAIKSKRFTMAAMAEGEFCGTCHDGDTAFSTETACLSCHAVSQEPIMWSEPTKASFSHTAHIEDMGLTCNDCHSGNFTMKIGAASNRGDFTMAAFKEGKYCGSCHNGDDAFDSASQCESCHFPPAEKIVFNKPVKTVVFDHKIHVDKAGIDCESCHKEVFTMKQGTIAGQELIQSENPEEKREYLVKLHTKYCGTCHDSSQAFGYLTRCTVCHIGVKGYDRMHGKDQKDDGHGKGGH
ncbi:MAG: c(7)-type cytochrome triheme domain-containing protein [Thermodesulfobacteriota bacterium]